MGHRDILEEWKKHTFHLSSPLNFQPSISRTDVEFTYNTLREYFPKGFFKIKTSNFYDIDKECWIIALLLKIDNPTCIDELFDIARLIDYSNTLDSELRKNMKSLVKSPRNLRDFFFELFIYNTLDKNGVPNKKKVISGNQELEGTCNILGKEYLFECRKAYYPNIAELGISTLISEYFIKNVKYVNKPYGFIAAVYFKGNKSGRLKDIYYERITKFFKEYNATNPILKIDYDADDEFGQFKVIDYEIADLIEIKNKSDYNVLFYFDGSTFKSTINFYVEHDLIYEKFKSILKEKRKQHKNSEYSDKILFIDSESHAEFNMGLFQTSSMYDLSRVKEIYEQYCSDWIVCVIRRDSLKQVPQISIDFLHQEHHKDTVAFLYSLFEHK